MININKKSHNKILMIIFILIAMQNLLLKNIQMNQDCPCCLLRMDKIIATSSSESTPHLSSIFWCARCNILF